MYFHVESESGITNQIGTLGRTYYDIIGRADGATVPIVSTDSFNVVQSGHSEGLQIGRRSNNDASDNGNRSSYDFSVVRCGATRYRSFCGEVAISATHYATLK